MRRNRLKYSVVKDNFKKYMPEMFLLSVVIILGILLGSVSPYIWGKTIDALTAKKSVLFQKYLVIQLFIGMGTTIFVYLETCIGGIIAPKLVNELKKGIFEKIIHMKCTNLDSYTKGELLNRIENDVSSIVSIYVDFYTSLFQIIFNFIFSLIVILNISKTLSLLALLSFVFSYSVNALFKKKYRAITKEQKEFNDKYFGFVNEMLHNILGIKAYKLEQKTINKYSGFLDKKIIIDKKQVFLNGKISLLKNCISHFFNITSLLLGGLLICESLLTLGNLIAFNEYLERLLEAIKKILSLNMNINTLEINKERLEKIMYSESELSNTCEKLIPMEICSINIKKLRFSYDDKKNILNNLNLKIEKSGLYTIVGSNGSGKSTILKILFGLYSKEGEILFNNKTMEGYDLKALRDEICYVSKEAFLLNDSIFQNISLGNETITSEQAQSACYCVGLQKYLDSLSEGINTIIGETGDFLSSGLKQKLLMARVIVQDYSLILLDEVTSDLDASAEREIIKIIRNIAKNKIVIQISHRTMPILASDEIYLLEKGRIKDFGSHDEMLQRNVDYQKLFSVLTE